MRVSGQTASMFSFCSGDVHVYEGGRMRDVRLPGRGDWLETGRRYLRWRSVDLWLLYENNPYWLAGWRLRVVRDRSP